MTTINSARADLRAGEPTDLTELPLYDLARLVRVDWRNQYGVPTVWFGAVPYLNAMESLESVSDMYLSDRGDMIVAYFLANAAQWRGPVARAVKAELKRRVGA